ncbi:adenosine deaminase domain-containing protein 1-like [Mya arenaria]|uniref:adenosine deaminase domain-containing protein 1-like n=1 Tax=Mya arenaria TaxID=6604 RepID=UPI0022E1FF43|nr:adenosine deaminase domain-containing protein 1-like [Mya arenaria]XP_052799738.1 adenosine deaminase domain-containing protein 1-like [Mya arenaria]XP_052799739.1 adenosine deaminase domain-containing protein 1-like [Mya arenaria]XP_052799740.1 adenosine deaminase domain-containing protein 1-like [Mya arenaria]
MATRYIPGLTARPESGPELPRADTPKDVPIELIEDFKNGTKQPISALMEYSAMQRHTTTFKEVPVKNYSLVNKFANQCSVNGVAYPQGTGKTKKEAKTNAAFIAFNIILGLETYEDYGDETPDIFLPPTPISQERELYNRLGTGGASAGNQTVIDSGEYQAPPKKRDNNRIFQDWLDKMQKMGRVEVLDGPFGYIGKVVVGGRTVCEETAKNKREAREAALEVAIESLQIGEQLIRRDHWEDMIAKECYKKLESLIAMCKSQDIHKARHSFAAFIVNRGQENMKPEVVAMGTGNTCLSSDNLTTDGRSVIDSYAVAIARRALLKYFHKEAKRYLEGGQVLSIFTESSQGGKLQLKDHITLHLFLNHPPPGDYRDCLEIPCKPLSNNEEEHLEEGAHYPAFSDDLPGWFSVKNEDGVIECVEEDQPPVQNYEELQEGSEDLLVMSCSDKLLLWNTVGIQGGLFSAFLMPIYIDSVILGRQYHHGHLSRALCCRLYDVVNRYLPTPFRLHHPHLSTGTLHIEEMEGSGTQLSINWSEGDDKPEVLNGFCGKVIDESPFRSTKNPGLCSSRLCKAGFLFRFRDIGKLLKSRDMLQAPNYQAAKELDVDYQEAKKVFRNFTHKIGLGHWIQKPKEIEQFVS